MTERFTDLNETFSCFFSQQGVIHKGEDTYFIEPQWKAINSSGYLLEDDFDDGHPHVIVKRSTGAAHPDEGSSMGSCGNRGTNIAQYLQYIILISSHV